MKINELKKLVNDKNIILLGAGQLGDMSLKLWPPSVKLPVAILDKSKRGYLNGIKIENVQEHAWNNQNLYVLSYFISDPIEIIELFEKIGQKIVTVYDIMTTYSYETFSNGWMGSADSIPIAESVSCLFDDKFSKEIYKSALKWRYCRILDDKTQLIPKDKNYSIKCFTEAKHFGFIVDGGAYDLSFANQLWEQSITTDIYYAVEPDEEVFNRAKASFHDGHITSVAKHHEFINKALWCNEKPQMFNRTGTMASRIVESNFELMKNNPIEINCIKLSDLFNCYKDTNTLYSDVLIKLHIEGAEFQVLNEFVCNSKLKNVNVHILVNLSHDEQSFIKIPQLLHSNGFSMRLTSYSLFGEGLTLYANRSFH